MAFSMECARFTSEIIITNEEHLKKNYLHESLKRIFLIKSIVDYLGDDTGNQLTLRFVLRDSVVRGREIPASLQPWVLLR